MEAFALYLLKSVIWLAGFALVFILFLRNERFFLLNRIYLLAGILISFLFPLISIHYTVVLPVVRTLQSGGAAVTEVQDPGNSLIPELKIMLLVLYLSGVLFLLTLIIRQCRSVLRAVRRSEIITEHPVKLIKTTDYISAFSFFSYVFVNPSITDVETKEIMNHELVHIRQKHWFDLLLVEMLCMMQWFNPLVWIYVRFIRQNHEYLADEVALQRTSDPAIYRAALLNQMVGSPVVSLVNSFNYSLNKKRFNMMKNIISSPYRKMKILFILPVFAIMFYAFARPDYKYKYADGNSGNNVSGTSLQEKSVRGKVVQNDGTPLPGATIIVKGTTAGTSADAKGSFKIDNVPDDGLLTVSFVGFKPKVLKPVFTSEMTINMVKDTVKYLNSNISTPPPPPPPPPDNVGNSSTPPPPPPPSEFNVRPIDAKDGKTPLIVVDGVVKDNDVNKIDPETIASITVLKDESAINKYGEKAKNGAIEVTTKNYNSSKTEDKLSEVKVTGYSTDQKVVKGEYVVVEVLPEFPGGKDAMEAWIVANVKYPGEAVKGKITGKVFVDFVVTGKGKIKNVVVSRPVSPLLDAEAVRVISSMPDWKPGSQAGKQVAVQLQVPVEFKLK
jgi:TonB family protein